MKIFRIPNALVLAFAITSCHSEEEPTKEVGLGRHIDEAELEAIHMLYDSLHLSDCAEYSDWVTNGNRPGEFYTDLQDIYVTSRQGLKFGVDTVTNRYVVTEMDFRTLPNRSDLSLPDIFDCFKHLKKFTVYLPSEARIKFPRTLCECPLEELKIRSESKETLTGPLPDNFAKLGKTMKEINIWGTSLGNELLDYILAFQNLTFCSLPNNDFTGKVPYLHINGNYYNFGSNHFTEFDWRYFDDMLDKYRYWSLYIPLLSYNDIEGPLPDSFRQYMNSSGMNSSNISQTDFINAMRFFFDNNHVYEKDFLALVKEVWGYTITI